MGDREVIATAVELYLNSHTSRGDFSHTTIPGLGRHSRFEAYRAKYQRYAREGSRRLRRTHQAHGINFLAGMNSRPEDGCVMAHNISKGETIEVDAGYRRDILATSILLAHETTHSVFPSDNFASIPYLEEEISCRIIQSIFYEELKDSPNLINSVQANEELDLAVFLNRNALNMDAGDGVNGNLNWAKNSTLIDYLLASANYSQALPATWIARNLDNWGGLRRRYDFSKGIYIRKLVTGGARFVEQIWRILDSIPSGSEARIVLSNAGPRWELMHVLSPSEVTPYSMRPHFSGQFPRIARFEARVGVRILASDVPEGLGHPRRVVQCQY